ncbi:MAG: hypothetical protein KatS3mg012_2277 [Gaiellaceae bacterium]|jgi:hypothetical protein|nr:MAG: hypothetical protein KatS3mg012_2277 [Gaiellaceae bacterium]
MLAWRAMDRAQEPSAGTLGAWARLLAALVGLALVVAVFAGGGSGSRGTFPVGALALGVLAAALVAIGIGRAPAPRLGRSGALLVAALVGLVAWTGATVAWSIAPDRSWDAFNKALAFAAFLGLGLVLAAAAGRFAARLAASLLTAVIGAALAWALVTKVFPGLADDGPVARLNEPVDYWNALALLADAALALGLWVGTSGTARGLRVGGALLVYVATLALALSLSRVGVLAGLAVLALALALAERRAESALLLVASATPAALVSAWAFTRPALVEDGLDAASREGDGALLGALTLLGALVVVALVLLVSRPVLDERARGWINRALAAGGALLALGAVGVLGLATVSAVSSDRTCAEVANDPSRLGTIDLNSRLCWWSEAWQVFREHSPVGAGAGTFELARKRYREDARTVAQPHSVPLQQLADGGVVGFALWWLLVGAGVATSRCALRRLAGAERAAAGAIAALPLAYGIHSLVDLDWDFLAVTGPTLAALGALAAAGRGRVELRRRPLLLAGTVLVTSAALVSLASPWLAERAVRGSTRALVQADLERAESEARRAKRWNPLSIEPLVALARVEEARGALAAAERRYLDAVELQPRNPEAWYALGIFELEVLERLCAAYRFLNEAYTLDPAGRQWYPGGPLDVARDAVNAGACE